MNKKPLPCEKAGQIDEWVIVEVDERQQAYEERGNEEDIVERMYSRIKILMEGNL